MGKEKASSQAEVAHILTNRGGFVTSLGRHRCLQQTMQCPKEKYWDKLLNRCMSCQLTWCHPPKFKQCADYCSSQVCSKQEGFYYDRLLRKCVNCSPICGRHPQECQSFCKNFPAATLPIPAALQSAQCKLDGTCDQQLVVYMVLGLCLCALLFNLLLTWFYFRKREEDGTCRASPVTCHKMGNNPKDRLVEAGSVGSGSSGSQTPEPVETCGFCFPEQSPAVQETRAGYRTYQLGAQGEAGMVGTPGTGCAGTIPTPEDSHFQIICSPSQEKMQMA